MAVLEDRRRICMACKFWDRHGIELAPQTLNCCITPSCWCKVALVVNFCSLCHVLYNRGNTVFLQWNFLVPHVSFRRVNGLQIKGVYAFWPVVDVFLQSPIWIFLPAVETKNLVAIFLSFRWFVRFTVSCLCVLQTLCDNTRPRPTRPCCCCSPTWRWNMVSEVVLFQ